MAKITGSLVIARAYWVRGSASGALAGGGAQANAECGMRNAEFQGKVGARSAPSAASLIDLA